MVVWEQDGLEGACGRATDFQNHVLRQGEQLKGQQWATRLTERTYIRRASVVLCFQVSSGIQEVGRCFVITDWQSGPKMGEPGKVFYFRVSTGIEEVGRCFVIMRGFHVTRSTGLSCLVCSSGFSGSGPSCIAHAQNEHCPQVGLLCWRESLLFTKLQVSVALPSQFMLGPCWGSALTFFDPSYSSHWELLETRSPQESGWLPHSSFSRRLCVECLFCSRNIFRPTAKGLCLKYLWK